MGIEKQRKMKLPRSRKLQVLKTLTKSKSVKKNSIIMDAFIFIYKLRMQVEAIKKEYHSLINNHIQEVKVEKLVEVEGYFMVRVACKKREQLLVRILEVFEEMKLNVVHARVASKHLFRMEAIVQASDIDEGFLNQRILKVVQV